MEIKVREDGDVVVVELPPKILALTHEVMLWQTLGTLLEAGKRTILLDLRRVTYLDSSGLAELVACFLRARERGGEMKLIHPSPRIHDLFRITGIDRVFEICREEEAALDASAFG